MPNISVSITFSVPDPLRQEDGRHLWTDAVEFHAVAARKYEIRYLYRGEDNLGAAIQHASTTLVTDLTDKLRAVREPSEITAHQMVAKRED